MRPAAQGLRISVSPVAKCEVSELQKRQNFFGNATYLAKLIRRTDDKLEDIHTDIDIGLQPRRHLFGRTCHGPTVDDIIVDGRTIKTFQVIAHTFPALARIVVHIGKAIPGLRVFLPGKFFRARRLDRFPVLGVFFR